MKIITELPFKTPTGDMVYYQTGQGMGIYSSWAIIALTHHIIVRLAAYRVGIKDFQDYIILGDDVTIGNEAVAGSYAKIIEQLGMEIRLTKSVIPHQDYNSVEFASKLIVNGRNIRPLPLGLLLQGDSIRMISLVLTTCTTLAEAGVRRPVKRVLVSMAPSSSCETREGVDRLTTDLKVVTGKTEFFWSLLGVVAGYAFYKSKGHNLTYVDPLSDTGIP